MRRFFVMTLLCATLFTFAQNAEAQEFPKMDNSPMDAAYFPARAAFRGFANTDEERKAGEHKIRVIYYNSI